MIPVVFINCTRFPFLMWIMSGLKPHETRSRNTLRALVGQRVYLAQTGRGRPVVVASAVIRSAFSLDTRTAWNMFRNYTRVPEGSGYDWTDSTRRKWLYKLCDVQPVPVPFTPPESTRHGRVWMEYIPEGGK